MRKPVQPTPLIYGQTNLYERGEDRCEEGRGSKPSSRRKNSWQQKWRTFQLSEALKLEKPKALQFVSLLS